MKIVFSEKCLEYASPGHPESPDRVRLAHEYLKDGYEFVEPGTASEADLLLVHSEEHLRRLKSLRFLDLDSPPYPDIYKYAALSAGAAIAAAKKSGFSLMRPPGHHAGRSSVAGFCYVNNVAIAVKKLARKTLIVDIDGHHGNGTEEIFLGDANVTYVSLHRHPLYPGTGLDSRDNCHNYPLPAFCGDEAYLKTFENALDSIGMDGVQQVAISAGFDAHESDPLASLGLSSHAYRRIGEIISKLGVPVFAVLEGGYDGTALGPNIEQLLQGMAQKE
ncbi:MAG: histone deacetylase family protein [Candidatus Eisenbacteria bacterium]|nr:histone deacetylase family protein [Candidatus Eisenbacteria bacterium]